MTRRMLACVAVAVIAPACGAGGSGQALPSSTDVSFVSAVAAHSVQTGSAKITMTMSVSGATTPEITLHGDGATDFARKLFDLRMQIPTGPSSTGQGEFIYGAGAIYERLPDSLSSILGIGSKWIRIGIGQGNNTVAGLSNLQDPTAIFDALTSIASSVTIIGHVPVRDVETTEYAVTLDQKKIAARLPASEKKALAGVPSVINVFVSADRLIRREEMHGAAAGGTDFSVVIELYDYGKAVNISIPPLNDVVDAGSIHIPGA